MMAWIENGLAAASGAGVGVAAALLAQATGGGQEVAWTGFGVTATFIGYLTGVVIREKDRQIEKLANNITAIIDAKDKERESTIARKDAELALARTEYLKSVEKLTESHVAEQQRMCDRCKEELALVREMYEGRARGKPS